MKDITYIIVEHFNDTLNLHLDSEGEVYQTSDLQEAKNELSLLQGGYIFPLGHVMTFIENTAQAEIGDFLFIQSEARMISGYPSLIGDKPC